VNSDAVRHAARPALAEIPPSLAGSAADLETLLPQDDPPPQNTGGRPGRYPWIVALAIGAIALWLFLSGGGRETPATRLLTAAVEVGDIESAVTAAGRVQPGKFVDVGAQVSGQLEKLHVAVGDRVTSGQLVAEIDAAVQSNRVEASRANLEALEAQLPARESSVTLAQARLERQTNMLARNASSEDDYDNAVDRLASAQSSLVQLRSQISQARATLGSDEATLGYSKIYAPIAGTVVSIEMQEGQTLNAVQMAPVILRIADLSTMTVKAEVSEADIGKLNPGTDVYFTTLGSGERRWTGKLRQILPTPVSENNVVLYTALFDADNADGALLMNMTAQVFFVTESANDVLTIPVGAISYRSAAMAPRKASGSSPGLKNSVSAVDRVHDSTPSENGQAAVNSKEGTGRRGSEAIVRVVDNNGALAIRPVEVGVTDRISAEILSGLREGEVVAVGYPDEPDSND